MTAAKSDLLVWGCVIHNATLTFLNLTASFSPVVVQLD